MKSWKPPYKTEAELCAAFGEHAKSHGWAVYAETCEWDMLLVGPESIQVGIQAKMRFNAAVLRQTLPTQWGMESPGPDFRAILLPSADRDVEECCEAIGIIVFKPYPKYAGLAPEPVIEFHKLDFLTSRWHGEFQRRWNHPCRHPLPDYVPDVAAGSPAPIRLTEWKISALRICAEIEVRGGITAKRMRELGCDARRWRQSDWVIPHPEYDGARNGEWIAGPNLRFPAQHPDVYKQILEEARSSVETC